MTRSRAHVAWLVAGVVLMGCGAPGSSSAPGASSSERVATSGPASSAPAVSSAAQPPPLERACTRDEECAVSRIEASGPEVCCPICGAIPATRRSVAALKLHCGGQSVLECRAMDCPVEPRRAVCKAGLCDSESSTDDKLFDRHQCLPAMRCDDWVGCAAITGNDQDGWYVRQADQAKPGELVSVDQACTSADTKCTAARVHSVGVACPPHGIPPLIQPPPYVCKEDGARCVQAPR